MSTQNVDQTVFHATIDGKPGRKFSKNNRSFMNATWTAFNRYAKGRGFTEPVSGAQYLGALAWRNPATGALMDLRRA